MDSHIMNFVHKGRTFPSKVGVKCFPQQTYGLSEESPEYFKNDHSYEAQNGYTYKYDGLKDFEYLSQKHYFTIDHSKDQNLVGEIGSVKNSNERCFHLKKGLLGDFMDHHAWKSKVQKLMGHERSDKARELSNLDRAKRIKSLKLKPNFNNPKAMRANHQFLSPIKTCNLMSEKPRIRKQRNSVASTIKPATSRQIYRTNDNINFMVQKNSISESMRNTAKSWLSTSPQRNRNRKPRLDQSSTLNLEELSEPETLEKWYRTTCTSKWIYKAPVREETEEMQAELV